MTIELHGFDEIIHPGQPLIAAPHHFPLIFKGDQVIDVRAYLMAKIAMYTANETKPRNLEESKAWQAGEALRRTLLKRRQNELAKYPKLMLKPSATYLPDTSAATPPAMRHRKD